MLSAKEAEGNGWRQKMEPSLWLCSREYRQGEEPMPMLAGNKPGCGHRDGRERGKVLLARRGLLTASEGGLGGYWCGAELALLAEEGEQPPMEGMHQCLEDEVPGKVG